MPTFVVLLRSGRRFEIKNAIEPAVEGAFLVFRAHGSVSPAPVVATFPADFVASAIVSDTAIVNDLDQEE